MADFHQNGVVTTLHRLDAGDQDLIERELVEFSRTQRIALVLPALFSEFTRPAMSRIIRDLRHAAYVHEIVVSLDRASEAEFELARRAFDEVPQQVRVLWHDGPRLQALYDLLVEHGLPIGMPGKGRGCWMAYGYVLASGVSETIAVHDCDITTYNRELLARLCYPVANPNLGFEFAKGYYSRTSRKMHGRVTRLFMTPLIRTLQSLVGRLPLLVYLDSFRYALAGEFAMKAELARVNRVPPDWGLEVGMLAEVYRNCAPRRICQTELCGNYDHKHQEVITGNPERGLVRMCVDIAQILLRTLAAEGVVFTDGMFQTLLVQYIRIAEDMVDRYHADAAINGLRFDRHEEETTVGAFSGGLETACRRFRDDPLGVPLIPSWNRITSAIPDFLDRLHDAVDEDNLMAVRREAAIA